MSFQHWFNSETTWNQHRITSYQRCFSTVKQYGINVISTFTHDIETILHQQSLNKCIQHWINIIPISQTMLIQHQITMLHQCCSQMWDQHYINTYSGYWNNIASTFVQCLFATLDQHNFDEQKTLIQQQTSTLHQRCSQCRINVISTFTHDTETTLHQHTFNVYMQHLINVISMSKKNIDSMTDINIASMLLLILDQCWINVFLLSGKARNVIFDYSTWIVNSWFPSWSRILIRLRCSVVSIRSTVSPLSEMASMSSIQLQTHTLDFIGWLSLSQIALSNTLTVMEEILPLHCIDGARRSNG